MIHIVDRVSSTNTWLSSNSMGGNDCILALQQTGGKGRGDRVWESPPGGLYLSIISPSHSLLPLIAGISVIQTLVGLDNRLRLKWPNDICVHGKKVAGILGETSHGAAGPEWAVLGIGVNVHAGPPAHAQMRQPASFLAEQCEDAPDRVELLLQLVRALAEHYPELGQAPLLSAWERRMLWRGKRVRALNPEGTSIEGIALGLDPDGALRLQPDDGRALSIVAGDVSLSDA